MCCSESELVEFDRSVGVGEPESGCLQLPWCRLPCEWVVVGQDSPLPDRDPRGLKDDRTRCLELLGELGGSVFESWPEAALVVRERFPHGGQGRNVHETDHWLGALVSDGKGDAGERIAEPQENQLVQEFCWKKWNVDRQEEGPLLFSGGQVGERGDDAGYRSGCDDVVRDCSEVCGGVAFQAGREGTTDDGDVAAKRMKGCDGAPEKG